MFNISHKERSCFIKNYKKAESTDETEYASETSNLITAEHRFGILSSCTKNKG